MATAVSPLELEMRGGYVFFLNDVVARKSATEPQNCCNVGFLIRDWKKKRSIGLYIFWLERKKKQLRKDTIRNPLPPLCKHQIVRSENLIVGYHVSKPLQHL